MASEDLQQWMAEAPPEKKKTPWRAALAGALCVLLLAGVLLTVFLPKASSDGFHLVMLRAGKADCFLVVADGKSLLVDTGNKGFSPQIVRAMHWFGIRKLDAVLITHPHKDHIGSLAELLGKVRVDAVYQSGESEKSGVYKNAQAAIAKAGTPSYILARGDRFSVGELACEVLGPVRTDYEEENDRSLVVRLTWQGRTFLFTGDMEAEAEKDLLAGGADLSADVLKVAHHGRKDSTSEAFLAAVRPEIALVPCEEAEQGITEIEKVLNSLAEAGIKVYRADRDGPCRLTIENGEIRVRKVPFLWEFLQS